MTVPTQSPQARLPGPVTYGIDPGASTIAFVIRHLFGLGEVRGSFGVTGGRITVGEQSGADVAVTVAAGSVDTGNARRDAAVRSSGFLDSEAHPRITFRSTGVVREGETWLVLGEVTARGMTKFEGIAARRVHLEIAARADRIG